MPVMSGRILSALPCTPLGTFLHLCLFVTLSELLCTLFAHSCILVGALARGARNGEVDVDLVGEGQKTWILFGATRVDTSQIG